MSDEPICTDPRGHYWRAVDSERSQCSRCGVIFRDEPDYAKECEELRAQLAAAAYELERADVLYREAIGRLSDVVALLPPEDVTAPDGKVYRFVDPAPMAERDRLDRIRAAVKGESGLRKFLEWPHGEQDYAK